MARFVRSTAADGRGHRFASRSRRSVDESGLTSVNPGPVYYWIMTYETIRMTGEGHVVTTPARAPKNSGAARPFEDGGTAHAVAKTQMPAFVVRFTMSKEAGRSAWGRARSLGYCERTPRARTLAVLCFDTPDRALCRAGISLQLEQRGQRWVQMVTCRGMANDESCVDRKSGVQSPAPALDRIANPTLRNQMIRVIGEKRLELFCELRIKRAVGELLDDGAVRAGMTVEMGDRTAGTQVAPWRRIELELLDGEPAGLFRIAKALFPSGGLELSGYFDETCGAMLGSQAVRERPVDPRKAVPVRLRKSETVEAAACRILRECQQQIAHNIDVIGNTTDPEGPHQLRVGLRRLRSALSVFKSVFPGDETTRLRAEAQWLGAEVGRLRDLDAVIADVVEPAAEEFAEESGFEALIESLRAEADRCRDGLRDTLRTERVQAFGLDMIQLVETCRVPSDPAAEPPSLAGASVRTFADAALRKRWHKAAKRGAAIETLTTEQRHELRKELKKVRYLTEFFAPLYPKQRVAPFLKQLKKLQTLFGALNDAQVAQRVLDMRRPESRDEPAAVERAAGCVIGATRTQAMFDWRRARKYWARLGRTRPFWR